MRTADQIVPRLLANTGRQKRVLDLLEIADDIKQLSHYLGSLNKVADTISISSGMLSKFLSAHKLSTQAKKLVKERKIDSVELVNKLSKFTALEQEWIAEQVIHGDLNSIDIRLLSPLRKQYPEIPLADLMTKLTNSKDKRVSVIKFSSDTIHQNRNDINKKIIEIVGSLELIDFNLNGTEGTIRLTKKGEKELRKAARQAKKSLQEFTYAILQ